MSAPLSLSFEQALVRNVEARLRDEAERIIDEEIKAAQKRVEERMGESRAQIVVDVCSFFEVQRMGQMLTIRVEVPKES